MSKDRQDILEYIENEISKTPLYGLLVVDGINELKHRVIDIICGDTINSDLVSSHYYLISPDKRDIRREYHR